MASTSPENIGQDGSTDTFHLCAREGAREGPYIENAYLSETTESPAWRFPRWWSIAAALFLAYLPSLRITR